LNNAGNTEDNAGDSTECRDGIGKCKFKAACECAGVPHSFEQVDKLRTAGQERRDERAQAGAYERDAGLKGEGE
jgi:hypothetical protein